MIHRFEMDGRYIVLDVCSGSVHVVDETAYRMIGMYPEMGREELIARALTWFGPEDEAELNEIYDEITALKDAGKLFAPDVFEPMAGELKKRTSGVDRKSVV